MTDPCVEAGSFAWTATDGYHHYPPYVNLTGNNLVVRGHEQRVNGYWAQGERVAVDLPDEAIAGLLAAMHSSRPKEDGLSCEMCDDPATCPAEQCAFRTTQASELVALKGEIERLSLELEHIRDGEYDGDIPARAFARQALTVSPENGK